MDFIHMRYLKNMLSFLQIFKFLLSILQTFKSSVFFLLCFLLAILPSNENVTVSFISGLCDYALFFLLMS